MQLPPGVLNFFDPYIHNARFDGDTIPWTPHVNSVNSPFKRHKVLHDHIKHSINNWSCKVHIVQIGKVSVIYLVIVLLLFLSLLFFLDMIYMSVELCLGTKITYPIQIYVSQNNYFTTQKLFEKIILCHKLFCWWLFWIKVRIYGENFIQTDKMLYRNI